MPAIHLSDAGVTFEQSERIVQQAVQWLGLTPAGMALIAAVPLVLVHALSRRFGWLDGEPRHRLLSAAGGVPVAYVFLQLLPGLAHGQQTLERLGMSQASGALAGLAGHLNHHVYLAALVSFLAFYGLERLVAGGRASVPGANSAAGGPSAAVFWLYVGSFALTNALTGYLLVQRAHAGPRPLAVFTVAMALWFLVNDRGLYARYGRRYERIGRWVLAAALLGGWAAGVLADPGLGVVPTLLQAVITGSVLLNVLAVEVPQGQHSRFWPFALGVAVYSALLLAL